MEFLHILDFSNIQIYTCREKYCEKILSTVLLSISTRFSGIFNSRFQSKVSKSIKIFKKLKIHIDAISDCVLVSFYIKYLSQAT